MTVNTLHFIRNCQCLLLIIYTRKNTADILKFFFMRNIAQLVNYFYSRADFRSIDKFCVRIFYKRKIFSDLIFFIHFLTDVLYFFFSQCRFYDSYTIASSYFRFALRTKTDDAYINSRADTFVQSRKQSCVSFISVSKKQDCRSPCRR